MLDFSSNVHIKFLEVCIYCLDNSFYIINSSYTFLLPFLIELSINFSNIISILINFFIKILNIEKNLLTLYPSLFDNFIFDKILIFSVFIFDIFSKNIFHIIDILYDSFFISHFPELVLFNLKTTTNNYANFHTSLQFIFLNKIMNIYLLNLILYLLNIFFIIYFILFFFNLFFSFFSSNSKEELTTDADYFFQNIVIESEKEIGSFDDIFMANIIFFFIFGWYFYINFFSYLSIYPELNLIFVFLPFFYILIILIPLSLLFDFGINYLVYLKGVNSSLIVAIEFMFDFIAFAVFFTRLVVQGVRLILMLFTFAGFSEMVLYFNYSYAYIPNFSSCIDSLLNFSKENYVYNLYIISLLPLKFIYFLYELFHTFFVLTIQSLAFFAMVFWLFLFLYTFFVEEKIEFYFSRMREENINQEC